MNQLKHYTELANELQTKNPHLHEIFEEEINIILHKLKFISLENRPIVQIIDGQNNVTESSYIEELKGIAGAQLTSPDKDMNDGIDILIFHETSPIFLSNLPKILSTQFSKSKAFQNNKIYIIQKSNFGTETTDFLIDTEILAEIIQSKYFVYGHEGIHWIQFSL